MPVIAKVGRSPLCPAAWHLHLLLCAALPELSNNNNPLSDHHNIENGHTDILKEVKRTAVPPHGTVQPPPSRRTAARERGRTSSSHRRAVRAAALHRAWHRPAVGCVLVGNYLNITYSLVVRAWMVSEDVAKVCQVPATQHCHKSAWTPSASQSISSWPSRETEEAAPLNSLSQRH